MASNNIKLSTYLANEITWERVIGKPTFSGGTTALAWGTTSTIANIGGNEVKITMPANPNTDHYDWSDITSKPTSFTPSSHTHAWADISNPPATATSWPTWDQVTGKPSTFAPSAHTHGWADLTNNADSLSEGASILTDNSEILTSYASDNGFADSNAKGKVYRRDALQMYNYIINKNIPWGNISGKPSTFAPASHTHSYLPLSGGTLTGAVTFANNTMNTMGDDCQIGDQNVAGALCIQGTNGATNIRFIQY